LAGRAIQELQIQGRRNKVDVQRGVTEIVAQWGHSYLGNNAGVSGLSLVDDPDDSKWFNILDTNLSGMYLITKEVLKHMPFHHGGRIINIWSVLGKFGVPSYTAYCTTKHGINETAAGVPIKRFLEADKIAELVCYLTLDQANGNHRSSD
jgi:NADP-dependent 3-hydroxy acid dehydrogenase YdfG